MKKRKDTRWKWISIIACTTIFLNGCAGMNVVETNHQILLSHSTSESDSSAGGKRMEALEPEKVNYQPDDFDRWNQLMDENRISEPFREALGQFAYQSGSQILSAADGNINYSPLSLYYAVALAGCGAEGETAARILDVLRMENQDQLAEQCRKLYQWVYYYGQREKAEHERYGMGEYESTIRLGNSLWVSDQMKLKEDYQKLAASDFFAASYPVDFTGPEAAEQIGDWISGQTNGVLKPALQLDHGTMMAIVNTLYFYGGWHEPFQTAQTADDTFTKADGTTVTVPFMNRVECMGRFRKGEGYTVSALYTNNNCSMVFLLPEPGRDVEEFLDSLDIMDTTPGENEISWQNGEVTWKIPKFSFGSSMRLVDLLKSMGLEKMFQPEQAEFGKISETPLFVSDVIQETHIGIDEEGVEGAAYTMMAMAAGASMRENEQKADMILDRPFLYGIQDHTTGAWLFLGVCRDP